MVRASTSTLLRPAPISVAAMASAATGATDNAWPSTVLIALVLVGVISLLVLFVRVLFNRGGALDRTVDRLYRLPAWTRAGRTPEQVRRSQQFTAAAGAALMVVIALLLVGLLMDRLGR